VNSVHFMVSHISHLNPILIVFLKATLPAWKHFSAEFSTNGIIHSLTLMEKLSMFIPPTNDTNESLLGGWQMCACMHSATTVAHFSAWESYHHNDMEAFLDAKLN
ncbi:hypothetical protein DFH08DRAFT_617410, partial [Mycena albidolilacea]